MLSRCARVGAVRDAAPTTAASLPRTSIAMLLRVRARIACGVDGLRRLVPPIYMAEENTDPARTLPRAIIGGALLVAVLYLIINVAFLRVLSMSVLAASHCRRRTPRGWCCRAAGAASW